MQNKYLTRKLFFKKIDCTQIGDEIMFTLGTLAHLLQGTMFPLGTWSHLSPNNLWYVYLNIMFPYDMYISCTFSDYIILQSNSYSG
jgi:hypothetical protein